MRRTLLAVLATMLSFVVTAGALVLVFQAISGTGERPARAASSAAAPTPQTSQPPSSSAPVSSPDASGSPANPPGGATSAPASSDDPSIASANIQTTSSPAGLLSNDFRTLGLDDPTTPLVDESVRSACDVVGATIAGPVLCTGR